VAPASYLPLIAKEHRAFILEINPSPTELSSSMTDLHVAEPAGEALPVIVEHLTRMSAS
jgi:NAD-dependent deacetylase